ncbi:MAG: hypothetical protein NVSMB17_04660 [Candidatus Dormibacteria bacterium]
MDQPASSGGQFGPRYLAYLAILVLLLGVYQRWELLGPRAVVALVVALMVLTALGTAAAFHGAESLRESARQPLHYVVPLMAIVVAASVSYLIQDWRLHLATQVLMSVAIFSSSYVTLERFFERERPGHEFLMNAAVILILLGGYLALLVGTTSLPLRLAVIFFGTALAAYELLGRVAQEQARAVVAALFVAQLVTMVAFGMFSVQFVDNSRLAGILLVTWYVNRDLARHLFEGTLTRNILAEYSVGLVLVAALVGSALLSR